MSDQTVVRRRIRTCGAATVLGLFCVVHQAFETQREYLLYQRVSAVGVVFLAKLKLRSSDLSFLQSVRPPSPRLKVLSHN